VSGRQVSAGEEGGKWSTRRGGGGVGGKRY
jgi:hypothetical protein